MDVLGRDAELAQIDGWLRAGAGHADAPAPPGGGPVTPGGVLVIEGEPGIGKTTLWGEVVRRARLAGWQVLSCRPVPSDAGLPHVGLTDLLRPIPASTFERLPRPQRRPLEVALLLQEAGERDLEPRAVGTGLTALLAAVAEAGPLLLAIDDAQWLDPASARSLAFALRRLDRSPVRVAAAVRIDAAPEPAAAQGPRAGAFAGIEAALGGQALTRLPVGPLSLASAYHMFRRRSGRVVPAAGAGADPPGLGRQPVLRPGDSPGDQPRRRPAARRPLPVPGNHSDLALLRLRRLPRATRDVLTRDLRDAQRVRQRRRPARRWPRPNGRASWWCSPRAGGVRAPAVRVGAVLLAAGGGPAGPAPPPGRRAGSPEERARHLALAADGPDGRDRGRVWTAPPRWPARGAPPTWPSS